MQFFLCEIVARLVAIYLCADCCRLVRNGLFERKIEYINSDLLDWWSHDVIHRDTAPVRYWMLIGAEITSLAACLFVAIFGWWQPNN
ncbi:hypothetical protein LJR220_004202 [Bradyrhizobium sp. LjRoot220]|uniref:hypothetical protein n=1 Tax=Bradyrhizobium sp. LjRoot220 TaxID=3342284 RepID=UPI003ED0696C